VKFPDGWRVEADEGTTLCNFRWWEQFDDPVLNSLIIKALHNNQDLRAAIDRVLDYQARFRVVNANLLPFVYANGNYSRSLFSRALPTNDPSAVLFPILNDYQGFFNLNWELDFWGRVRSASDAALAEWLMQIEVRRAVVVTVVTAVANNYITLRGLDGQLEVSRKTLQSRYESLKLAKYRFELGETSEIEVKQAEAEVEIALIRVIEFERDIPRQENLLSILLGENPRDIERGSPIEAFVYPMEIPTGLPSDLLERRPDIIAVENSLMAANARVTEAQALFFPQINLTGMYGNESAALSRFLTSPATMWQYALSAVQTLFDSGKIWYTVKGAEAQRNQVLAQYRQTILQAFREVNDALVSYNKNKELVAEHQIQVKVLNDYLNLAQLRYAEGEIDYLNVLDAERSLFNAQLQQVQAQADSFQAVVELYKALGGGWVIDADAQIE
jgi:multidrug efflux system outer membrane protein